MDEERMAVRIHPLQVVDEQRKRQMIRESSQEISQSVAGMAANVSRCQRVIRLGRGARNRADTGQHREQCGEPSAVPGQQRFHVCIRQHAQVRAQLINRLIERWIGHGFVLSGATRQHQ
jgi:hypothetical protein